MHSGSNIATKYSSPAASAMSMSPVAMGTAGMNVLPRFYGDNYNSFYGATGYGAAMGVIGTCKYSLNLHSLVCLVCVHVYMYFNFKLSKL